MCRRIFKEQTSETGDIPFYKIGTFGADPDAFISRELFEEYKSKYPYPQKGDILISASGSIGRTVEFAGNNEYFQDSNIVWLNHDERLSNPFLKCFYSVVKWAGIEGSTIKRLYNDNILNTVICMPSVPEQKRIGLFFENLDNLITLHQRECISFTGRADRLILTANKKRTTSSWEQRKLGDIGKARSGVGFPDADQGGVTGVPFFKVSDMNLDGNENEMIVANNYVTTEQIAEHRWSPITELPAIFFAKVGAAVMLNRKRLCRFPFLLDNNTMAYSLSPTKWDADFAKALFGTVDLTSLVQVGALPSYNAGDVESMGIYLPSLFEQEQIGAFFKLLDNLITLHQRQHFLHSTPDISLSVRLIHPFYTFSWEQRKLSEITDKVTEKNAGLQYVETFTNSAEFGIISQRDFFDHDIAKLGSLDGYYIVKNEDFVYNPRISTSAPVGPINRNKLGRTGVMSPLYTVFRPHDIDTTYLEYFFKCGYWHSFMNFNGDSGARSDRFSIRDNVFFQMPIPIPDIDEQRKIGELLTCLDNLITLHQRKGKAAVSGCSNDANNSKGVCCKARDFGYKCHKKDEPNRFDA